MLGPELVAKGGLRIHTTLDPRIQDLTQEEVATQVAAGGAGRDERRGGGRAPDDRRVAGNGGQRGLQQ